MIVLATPDWAGRMREELAERPWITPITTDADDLKGAFGTLRSMGLTRISAIGGRAMASALLDAGLVRDLYLTTSPRAGGEPNTPIYPKPIDGTVVVRKAGTGVEAGVMFEHLVI